MPGKKKPGNPGLKGRLLDKSIEAYVLSLETINRLSIKYRVETFSYLLCNSWELLLKSKILADANGLKSAIYYPKKRGERPRTLSLRDCVKKVFPNEKDPTRRNIEKLADLRDESTHLVISKIPPKVMGLFQASVRNYHTKLGDWFEVSLSDRVPIGMMTLVFDFDPKEADLSSAKLRRELGTDSASYLMSFEAGLQQEFNDLGKPAEFSIDINFKVALTQKAGEGDIILTKGSGGGKVVQMVEVPKSSDKTHPHRQIDVRNLLHQRMGLAKLPSAYNIESVRRVHGTDKNNQHFYKSEVTKTPQFSDAFVDWLVEKLKADPDFFEKAKVSDKAAKVK